MKRIEFVGLDVHAETIAVAVAELDGASDGMRHRDQGEYHSAVYSRIAFPPPARFNLKVVR
jgi:hypothetical protein